MYIFYKMLYAADKWELAGRVNGAGRVDEQEEWRRQRGRDSGRGRKSGSANFLCSSADFLKSSLNPCALCHS